MTDELKKLNIMELEELFTEVKDMRQQVLQLVQKYGFETNELVSQSFERSIEAEYGRKILKQRQKEKES